MNPLSALCLFVGVEQETACQRVVLRAALVWAKARMLELYQDNYKDQQSH